MRSISKQYAAKISLIYCIISAIWIFSSDRLLAAMIDNATLLARLQTYKGWFFVLVTTILLYLLIKKSTENLEKSRNKLVQTIQEKEVLLAEIHHRVKNNLAIITALIELQMLDNKSGSTMPELKRTKDRIFSIAKIHELLYKHEKLHNIPFHAFVYEIMDLETNDDNSQGRYTIESHLNELYLDINQAVPLGLLINEILSILSDEYRIHTDSVQISLSNYGSEVEIELRLDQSLPDLDKRINNSDEYFDATLVDVYSQQLEMDVAIQTNGTSTTLNLVFQKMQKQGAHASWSDLIQ